MSTAEERRRWDTVVFDVEQISPSPKTIGFWSAVLATAFSLTYGFS
jgi:hypothetical protein